MKNIAGIIATFYRNNELLPDTTIQCMEYTLTAIINEISKVIMYMIIFGFLGLLLNFLLAYVVFVSVRLFAGGIHCKTYWGCTIVSFIMLGSSVLVGLLCKNTGFGLFVFAIISLIFPAFLAPVTPSFRIIKADKHKLVLRVGAILVSLMWILIARLLIQNDILASTVFYTVLLANYQLIIPKLITTVKRGGVKK